MLSRYITGRLRNYLDMNTSKDMPYLLQNVWVGSVCEQQIHFLKVSLCCCQHQRIP